MKGASISEGHTFVNNNKSFLYQIADTLYILQLGTKKRRFLAGIESWSMPQENLDIMFVREKESGKCFLIELKDLKRRDLGKVDEGFFDKKGSILVIKRDEAKGNGTLGYLNLKTGLEKLIWHGSNENVSNVTISSSGEKVAFCARNRNNKKISSLWMYVRGDSSSVILVGENARKLPMGTQLGVKKMVFGHQGKTLFFYCREDLQKIDNPHSQRIIYSYLDPVAQLPKKVEEREFACAISTSGNSNVLQLENPLQLLLGSYRGISPQVIDEAMVNDGLTDDYAVVMRFQAELFPNSFFNYRLASFAWNKNTIADFLLLDLNTGMTRNILSATRLSSMGIPTVMFTPNRKSVIYFDPVEQNYYSYDIASEKNTNLTGKLPTVWTTGHGGGSTQGRDFFAPKRWGYNPFIGEDYILLQDGYEDIWQVSINGGRNYCITNRTGRNRRISYSLDYPSRRLKMNGQLLITGRFKENHHNGLFVVRFYRSVDPTRIAYGQANYSALEVWSPLDNFSSDNSVYVFEKESIDLPRSCQYVIGNRKAVSVATEVPVLARMQQIVTWKTTDGSLGIGKLYFPDNFDPAKKYPVIFDIYEKIDLYKFNYKSNDTKSPSSFGASLNEDFYLANGYMVFHPDLDYAPFLPGKTGDILMNTIISAANHLKGVAYVDASRIGIAGHSFGGYQVNYLITQSSIFAAACSGAGVTNLVSLAGSFDQSKTGFMSESGDENTQTRLGVLLWQRPDLYLKNSPVFHLEKVTTPILLMANKGDHAVPFTQGFEMHKSLRRLGKRSWLVEYENEGHLLNDEANCEDWGRREFQFFEHYLKGRPAPKWMTRPSQNQQTAVGFEEDDFIRTPAEGIVMENQKALSPQTKELLQNSTKVDRTGYVIKSKNNRL